MAIATATRSNDMSSVNKVLGSTEVDPEEEAALKKLVSKLQTDDERDHAVSQMILNERAAEVEGRFPSAKINPNTGDIIPEELRQQAVEHKEVMVQKANKPPKTVQGSAAPMVTDIDDQ